MRQYAFPDAAFKVGADDGANLHCTSIRFVQPRIVCWPAYAKFLETLFRDSNARGWAAGLSFGLVAEYMAGRIFDDRRISAL